jgi:hypothetical protein
LTLALRAEERDNALADADLALKQSLLNKALDAQVEAQRNLAEAHPGTTPAELAALQTAALQAADDVAVARLDVNAATRAVTARRPAPINGWRIATQTRRRPSSSGLAGRCLPPTAR